MSELQFDVVGAEGPRRYFGALSRDSLAHAYLFSGPPGVGKKTFARRLAQSLLCSAPKDGVLGYDASCPSCAMFSAGENARHPDFMEHDGALRIGDAASALGFYESEEMSARDIVRLLSMQSYVGGMRILLLGDVDFASPPAANALLKFVEEPPRGVLLVLTTATPGRLLATIRSRLIEVRFPRLSKGAVRDVLQRRGFAEADAELGASLAEGSVTRALGALEGEEESLRAQVARWFFESVEGKVPERSWATRETLDDGLQTVKALARDWIVAGTGSADAALVSVDYVPRLRRLRPLPPARAVELLAKLDDAARLARTNVAAGMVGEIVRMALTTAAGATRNA
ncbi:MAG: AAA family ATPase [Candidatus Tumulicola sp.]